MTKAWNHDGPAYRGSSKHKRRPGDEVKGTLCPQWSHETSESGLGTDMYAHNWQDSEAAKMFAQSEQHPDGLQRRFATKNGIAFEAKPTADGTWHGYPVPWQSVPTSLVQAWKRAGKVTSKEIRKYLKGEGGIDWAMVSDQ
ncbi:hypothetical protein [Sphingomonas kyeonggiensis]|uniref:Uncharacterized protein n=1 Tax=Sphingomonas kyeonggiensis TaxID=1268553 RepID=A0A7W6JPZ5_9SPHN|nr:hypothetical protein [Sphingomonas kyeonggiensis]MBB4097443.1 hypothetical protein [Sphingomonas kyeonggiensis]